MIININGKNKYPYDDIEIAILLMSANNPIEKKLIAKDLLDENYAVISPSAKKILQKII